jgi:hypothetical protein
MTQQYKENALLTNQRSSKDDENYSYEEKPSSPNPIPAEQPQSDVEQRDNSTNEEDTESDIVDSEDLDSESKEGKNKEKGITYQS